MRQRVIAHGLLGPDYPRVAMFERFEQPVRCSAGHVYTTIWIPLVSLKSVRLSGKRFQRCPVGDHWAVVVPIDSGSATADELAAASIVHDRRIP